MKNSRFPDGSENRKPTTASLKIPPAPKHLKSAGKEFWKVLLTEFAIPPDMLHVVETACLALDRADAASALLASEGLIVFDRFNQQKMHPAFIVERDSKMLFLRAIKQLNLSEPVNELLKMAKARK